MDKIWRGYIFSLFCAITRSRNFRLCAYSRFTFLRKFQILSQVAEEALFSVTESQCLVDYLIDFSVFNSWRFQGGRQKHLGMRFWFLWSRLKTVMVRGRTRLGVQKSLWKSEWEAEIWSEFLLPARLIYSDCSESMKRGCGMKGNWGWFLVSS